MISWHFMNEIEWILQVVNARRTMVMEKNVKL